MNGHNPDEYEYVEEWRESAAWRNVEVAVHNLIKDMYPDLDLMVSDFLVVAAGVPANGAGELLGFTDSLCSSVQSYIARGLLAEAVELENRNLES